MTHIWVSKLTIIGSDNSLSPDRRQAIIWTNAGLLLIGPLGTNFSEILIEILAFSLKKMRLKVSSTKRRPFCLGLNVLYEDHLDNRIRLKQWLKQTTCTVLPSCLYLYPTQWSWRTVYWIRLVRPSFCLSVCRRQGFQSVSAVYFEISISNFRCILIVAIGRSRLIFRDVTCKIAALWPYWFFVFVSGL